ncbi:MAG: hypothetical protein WC423_24820 [Vulcanimicrobiota bacterium]
MSAKESQDPHEVSFKSGFGRVPAYGVHFDLELGRLALATSSSLVEQTIYFQRIYQNIEMTFRRLE